MLPGCRVGSNPTRRGWDTAFGDSLERSTHLEDDNTIVPDREAFLTAPDAVVAAVAPATALWIMGGTRRRAVMEGIPLNTSYIEWSRQQMLESLRLFFRLGVRHLIVPTFGPHQMVEVGEYGANILTWALQALAGPAMVEEYRREGWRARLIVPASVPVLQEAAARLAQEPAPAGAPTVWYYFVTDHSEPWRDLLDAVHRTGARTYAEAQQALYGEEIPPASLLVGFGKPVIGPTLIPLLLADPDLQCYWTQRAGPRLPEPMLRAIIYDYAYTRRTFRPDHQARYNQSAAQQALWDTPAVLGLGVALNGFWYPEPFPGAQL